MIGEAGVNNLFSFLWLFRSLTRYAWSWNHISERQTSSRPSRYSLIEPLHEPLWFVPLAPTDSPFSKQRLPRQQPLPDPPRSALPEPPHQRSRHVWDPFLGGRGHAGDHERRQPRLGRGHAGRRQPRRWYGRGHATTPRQFPRRVLPSASRPLVRAPLPPPSTPTPSPAPASVLKTGFSAENDWTLQD